MFVLSVKAHAFSSCQSVYWHVLQFGMYYSRLCLFPPEYQSSIPQIRKKIFCSFYALSLSERNIILPQSYEKYEIRQRNPVKNKIIPVISVRNVEPLIEFVEPILRLSCVRR
jgi:hypothetical protein